MKLRAFISKNTVIDFTLKDIVNKTLSFSARELIIPWLQEGNEPVKCTDLTDQDNKLIFENDILEQKLYDLSGNYTKSLFYVVVWDVTQFNLGMLKKHRTKAQDNRRFDRKIGIKKFLCFEDKLSYKQIKKCKIVGNTFQNPELLLNESEVIMQTISKSIDIDLKETVTNVKKLMETLDPIKQKYIGLMVNPETFRTLERALNPNGVFPPDIKGTLQQTLYGMAVYKSIKVQPNILKPIEKLSDIEYVEKYGVTQSEAERIQEQSKKAGYGLWTT